MEVSKANFAGTWVSALPDDTEDYYRMEYRISPIGDSFDVKATHLQDGEAMLISNIRFDGETLEFGSYMPSTKRRGLNRFRLEDEKRIHAEFTFTVVEELKRPDPTTLQRHLAALPPGTS